jgi:hypothetical protein
MKPLTSYQDVHCANCATPMVGEFCHVCGQSIHSVLKPVHGMVEEAVETVLNVDGRIVHTLPPLLLRPGFLTLEYFSGKRQRYVAPFRLMFVLCVMAFFVLQLAIGNGDEMTPHPTVKVQASGFRQARTPAEVDQVLQKNLARLAPTQRIPLVGELASHQLDEARLQLMREAAQRRIELGDRTAVIPRQLDEQPPRRADRHQPTERELHNPFDSQWDMQKYPVVVGWFPDFLNHWMNRTLQHMHENLAAMKGRSGSSTQARERIVGQMFSSLPQTMFFVLPLFALLLKVVYLFRRRLYMEHLIVALHSHAFLFLSLLLGVLLRLFGGWLEPHASWLGLLCGLLAAAAWTWAPIYLLIMQKRVYRQGWTMTTLKYLFVGCCYCLLLGFALVIAFALGLAY